MSDQPNSNLDGGFQAAAPSDPALNRTQPADSQIKIDRFPDGVTIEVPPAGLWRGSRGLFGFAILWNGIIGLITVCLVGAFFGGQNAKGNDPLWVLPLVLSIFWIAGIGLLLAAINMGQRRAALAVTSGSLTVIQTGLFGSKQRDWAPDDLEGVHVGPSGMTVNDEPVLQLQIVDGGGNKFGLLTGRNPDELRWLAAELKTALPRLTHSGLQS